MNVQNNTFSGNSFPQCCEEEEEETEKEEYYELDEHMDLNGFTWRDFY